MTNLHNQLKVALVQADTRYDEVSGNLAMLEEMLESVVEEADIYLLPELFNTGYQNAFTTKPEAMGLATSKWMSLMAKRKNAAICGSISIAEGGSVFNRMLFALPEGGFLYYDKQRVFKFSGEHKVFTSGNSTTTWEFRGWRIKPIVCFDLRFPELSRNLTPYYDLLLCSAHWPKPRIMAWDKLLQARAIENQCFVAAVNRYGVEGQAQYPGHSVGIDFEGYEKTLCGDSAEIQVAVFDKDALNSFRSSFPFLPE